MYNTTRNTLSSSFTPNAAGAMRTSNHALKTNSLSNARRKSKIYSSVVIDKGLLIPRCLGSHRGQWSSLGLGNDQFRQVSTKASDMFAIVLHFLVIPTTNTIPQPLRDLMGKNKTCQVRSLSVIYSAARDAGERMG